MCKTYFCIDMKSFFASVECAERGLNPFDTPLIVADPSRGSGAICLAVSPKMKELGVKNRCRVFEIPKNIDYITALPRMKKYIEYTADIYELYLGYFSPEDIHIYSIDESFIDVTDYLIMYKLSPKELAEKIMREIWEKVGVPSSVGIGTNLYLAKIALDITAKKSPDRIGVLDERLYKKTLWNHTPLTDFWQISSGISKRLSKYGINTMFDITNVDEKLLYRELGINAELLIDHAYGREPCTIKDIKNYKSKSNSVNFSQILFEDYTFDKALLVFEEMIQNACYELMIRNKVATSGGFLVGYSKDVLPSDKASVRLSGNTNLFSVISPVLLEKFRQKIRRDTPIRKLSISFNVVDESYEAFDIFTDVDKAIKERDTEMSVLQIRKKYGKNSLLKGINLKEGATMQKRNKLIGGHNGE